MAPNAGDWGNGSDTSSDKETAATPAQPAGFPTLAVVGIAAGVIVVLALIAVLVLIVVLARRKNRTAPAGPSQQYPPQQFAPNQQRYCGDPNQQRQESQPKQG